MEPGQKKPRRRTRGSAKKSISWADGTPQKKRESAANITSDRRETSKRLADAEIYHDQFYGLTPTMKSAYMQVLVPGFIFKLKYDAVISTNPHYDRFPTICQAGWDKTWQAGAIAVYVGHQDVLRKNVDSQGNSVPMKARLHTFLINDKQVIPYQIDLLWPVRT